MSIKYYVLNTNIPIGVVERQFYKTGQNANSENLKTTLQMLEREEKWVSFKVNEVLERHMKF